jgi:hypothetical protein
MQAGPQMVGRADHTTARHVRPLGLADRIPQQLLDETSGVKGDFYAPFCGQPESTAVNIAITVIDRLSGHPVDSVEVTVTGLLAGKETGRIERSTDLRKISRTPAWG